MIGIILAFFRPRQKHSWLGDWLLTKPLGTKPLGQCLGLEWQLRSKLTYAELQLEMLGATLRNCMCPWGTGNWCTEVTEHPSFGDAVGNQLTISVDFGHTIAGWPIGNCWHGNSESGYIVTSLYTISWIPPRNKESLCSFLTWLRRQHGICGHFNEYKGFMWISHL